MTKKYIQEFVQSLSDGGQKEWIEYLEEDYNSSRNVIQRERARQRTKSYKNRKLIREKPCIAFDLFDGIEYHWTRDGKCISCGKVAQYKPLESCKSGKHHQQYYNERLNNRRKEK